MITAQVKVFRQLHTGKLELCIELTISVNNITVIVFERQWKIAK